MRINMKWQTMSFCITAFTLAGYLNGCSTDARRDQASGDVQSRAVPQAQQPPQPASPGQPAQLPTFPQKFNVQGPETQGFGFAVTQAGPIVVDVQGQGAPVIVTLQSPGGPPTTQQATGNLRMNYSVTPLDVQRSPFWTVQIRLAQPMPPQQGGRASGSVNVQHPPVNQTALQQAVQASAAQRRPPTDQERAQAASQVKAQMDATFQAHKAQFEQQQQQRRAALMAPLQPILAQMQAQTGTAVRPRGVEESSSSEAAAAPGDDVTSRGVRPEETPSNAPGADVESRGLASGTLMLSPAIVMPSPVISSLSVSQGQPGDSVLITGTGFGSNAGEVHFVIAPGIDKIAPTTGLLWRDTQIFANVPDVSGFSGYNGTVYVKRVTDKVSSNLMLFRFNPLPELRLIRCPNDDFILEKLVYTTLYSCAVWRMNQNWFWTPQGNDQFFVNTRLKNGWIVVQPPTVFYPNAQYTAGGAYIWESRVGTDSPYINVRYWVNAGFSNNLGYSTSLLIQGPKGVPDGIVCTQIPCL
jgi:IPT/TIG domain